jgi:prepilin peptidase CpaA
MMNDGFTLGLLGLLAALLGWIAVVDVRTYTISDRINAAIALLAPVYWLSAGFRWPGAAIRISHRAGFMFFAGAFSERDGRRRVKLAVPRTVVPL